MGRVRAPYRGFTRFRKTQVPHFALLHEAHHGSDGLVNRHLRIHTMLIIKIDSGRTQPSKASFTCLLHVLGPAIDTQEGSIGASHVTEFGGDDRLVPAPSRQGPSHQFLIAPNAVHIGGIEKRDPATERVMKSGNRFPLIGFAVELGHAHAAQSFG